MSLYSERLLMAQVDSAALTNIGLARTANEDRYAALPEFGLWIIADGMGGAAGGAVASELAVRTIVSACKSGAHLVGAVSAAHERIQDAARRDINLHSMGSTLVAVSLRDENYEMVWVGDSRGYLWDGRRFHQLTRDHTLTQSLIDSGIITRDEAATHPGQNVLTQALGMTGLPSVQAETACGVLRNGDTLLLCSDGLTKEVADHEIASVLQGPGRASAKAAALIDLSLKRGGSDNVTVILITIGEPVKETAGS